jgi:2-keto-4-pentenoate hydratase/2-oxohepta-3-ene-1,7-dioic acid hydratase in catechol pathway
MRFARYERQGAVSDGVLDADDRLHGLGAGEDTDTLIRQGGLDALRDAGTAALDRAAGPPLTEVRLLAPLRPASIRDSVSFDLELEVGVVYGAHGRNLTPEQAAGGIVGYTIFNDWSARDIQRLEGQLPFGFFKGKDGAHTLGPYLVTADELAPYKTADGLLDLTMRAWINGTLLGEDSLANCAFTFEELISFASRGSAVAPGDLLASGTCHRGCLTEIWGRAGERVPPPLVPGDVITLDVEGIGTVSNRIIDPAPCPPIPAARRGQPRGPRH